MLNLLILSYILNIQIVFLFVMCSCSESINDRTVFSEAPNEKELFGKVSTLLYVQYLQ